MQQDQQNKSMPLYMNVHAAQFLRAAAPDNGGGFSKDVLEMVSRKVPEWYSRFTTAKKKDLEKLEKQLQMMVRQPERPTRRLPDQHVLCYAAIEFMLAYLEPMERINMAFLGADETSRKGLEGMLDKLGEFHREEFGALEWLIDGLANTDALFPAQNIRNKVNCCFARVEHKHCYINSLKCVFEPSIAWIRMPHISMPVFQESAADDCCHGSTLSSCSGGTLSCDCVSGNTGCDCKSPNKLCSKNHKATVDTTGFADRFAETQPLCLALDLLGGRFDIEQNLKIDLQKLVFEKTDIIQNVFHPPT